MRGEGETDDVVLRGVRPRVRTSSWAERMNAASMAGRGVVSYEPVVRSRISPTSRREA